MYENLCKCASILAFYILPFDGLKSSCDDKQLLVNVSKMELFFNMWHKSHIFYFTLTHSHTVISFSNSLSRSNHCMLIWQSVCCAPNKWQPSLGGIVSASAAHSLCVSVYAFSVCRKSEKEN